MGFTNTSAMQHEKAVQDEAVRVAIAWLTDNRSQISYLRPRRWCGVDQFHAYNRKNMIPYIDGQPSLPDDPRDTRVHDAAVALGIPIEGAR